MEKRIDNPTDLADVRAFLTKGESVIVQFSSPDYTLHTLQKLDEIALHHGNNLQIRFYGHYQSTFDFNVLKFLPNVRNLSVDCLSSAINFMALDEMTNLSRLHIGIDNELPKDFLSMENLFSLDSLVMGPSKNKNLDLSHLIKYKKLKELFLAGHTKHIDSIRNLTALEKLGLSLIGKAQPLSFINTLHSLKSLMIILGGRDNIDEVTNSSVESMEIIRIRGLQKFDASKFPSLKRLRIEDQIQIHELSFSEDSPDLKSISIVNCKGLEKIDGLSKLKSLESLHFCNTKLNIDKLALQGFPQSLHEINFYTNSNKANKEIHLKLTSWGYKSRSIS